MKVPIEWLKEYVEIDLPPEELAEKLTMAGTEVSAIEHYGGEISDVFEVDILPNRGDCLSVIGMAREVAAVTQKSLKLPRVEIEEKNKEISTVARVEIKDFELCPRYMARVIEGVKVSESPDWLKNRLIAGGLRPINNVVDITNYVLLEMGQPLHAFDLNTLKDQKIIVRRAQKKEKIVTLDNETRELDENILVIADAQRPVAIAGVMGGRETEVSEITTSVLLESAYFEPSSINRVSKTLKLRTEASIRFERGVDWEGVARALDRAAALIRQLAGGEVLRGVIDIKEAERRPKIITLRPERVNKILGTEIKTEEMVKILKSLGFQIPDIQITGYPDIPVTIPFFRAGDIEREIDLIEEIARIYGYDKIPSTKPRVLVEEVGISRDERIKSKIREVLTGAGLTEITTFSIVSPESFNSINMPKTDSRRNVLQIANPISEEISIMRTTLLPSLLEGLKHNANRQIEEIAVFEIGKVYLPSTKKLPTERLSLAGALMGENENFYHLRGIIELLFGELGIECQFSSQTHYALHPQRSLAIQLTTSGYFGELHPDVQKSYDLPFKTYVFEIDLEPIFSLSPSPKIFKALPKFPSVRRDIAVIVPENVSHDAIVEVIKEKGKPLLEEIKLFDIYRGKPIPEGYSSLAYALTYRSLEKTLTDQEVNAQHAEIVKALTERLKVKVRK